MSTPPEQRQAEQRQPAPDDQVPGSGFLSAIMTIVALAPLGAVVGMVIAYKVNGDAALFALCGAAAGTLWAMVIRNK
jgi:hypothetical protein